MNPKVTIQLSYVTPSGFDWLNKTVEVDRNTFLTEVHSYQNEFESVARGLTEKWEREGETNCTLHFDVEYVSGEREVWKLIFSTLMKQELL